MAVYFLFLLFSFLSNLRPSVQQPDVPGHNLTYIGHVCSSSTLIGNSTSPSIYLKNSTYSSNLRTLMSSLSSNNQSFSSGFYSTVSGQHPDMVFGLFLCRGDVSPEICSECVVTAIADIMGRCPNSKTALIYYDECMLRYAERNILLHPIAEETGILQTNHQNVPANISVRFDTKLFSLMREAAEEAAASQKRFSIKKENITTSQTVYVMVQCTPDITRENCSSCLRSTTNKLTRDVIGGKLLWPSCTVRYEIYPFFNETLLGTQLPPPVSVPPPVSAPPLPSLQALLPPPKRGKGKVVIVAIVVPVTLAVCVLLFIVCYCFLAKRGKKTYETAAAGDDDAGDDIATSGPMQFDFKAIEAATNKYSENNKLGQGGFGEVYKGTFPNGIQVAIKRLSKTSVQGGKEFKNEVVVVGKLQHRNLVKLLGFCLERAEKILVDEFVPNKSLDYFLFDSLLKSQLDWSRRYKIIGGIARGILYLHQDSRLTIIHRDLKASNILLDADMNPKVADFGMARIFGLDQTEANTKIVVGTYGYMSPEYALYGQFSMKSDVYSFGVLVLEILSGKKNSTVYQMDDSSTGNLITYTWKLWSNGSPQELVDPSYQDDNQIDEIIRCINIALLCVQEEVEDRPTMSAVVQMLTTSSVVLAVPRPPVFFFRARDEQAGSSMDSSALLSSNHDGSTTQVSPR